MTHTEYPTLRDKIRAEKKAREGRYEGFAKAWERAMSAGEEAARAHRPTPMIVAEADGLSDRIRPDAASYYVSEGVCGFAWVAFKGNTSFAKWASKQGLIRDSYPSGKQWWCSLYGQSMERKEAHCQAMARVLRDRGIDCYASSRMD